MREWWMLGSLWALDVPIVALCWGTLIASFLGITLVTMGPMMLLFGMVWAYTLTTRVVHAMLGRNTHYAQYYREHAFPMLMLALCALLSSVWLLLFEVGRYLLIFMLVPLSMVIIAHAPLCKRIPYYTDFTLAASFIFACSVPAFYYSFRFSPIHMLTNAHLWCLVCLFTVFNLERKNSLNTEQEGEERQSLVILGILLLLFLPGACKVISAQSSPYEQFFYCTLCIGAVSVHSICRLRHVLSRESWYCVSWTAMALPAILGILHQAPSIWWY